MELFVASIVIAFVLWAVSPESLRRWLSQRLVQLFRSHPATAAKHEIDIFDGRVEILTERLLSRPAHATRTKQYYEAEGPLDWDIIAADADVERDQQAHLIELLNRPAKSLRLICILGESGTGKSTLAWRAAAKLHKQHQALVVRVKGWDAAEVWYRMPEFCSKIRRPVFVLADDLFRDSEVRLALRQLSPWLPITVLATSQTHEYRPGRIRGELISIRLRNVSPQERKNALCRLGRNPGDIDRSQPARLKEANDFLVLMAELTSGKGFESIVQESLDNLARGYQAVYRAYEYVCLAYSYGVPLPSTFLERLDDHGSLHDLPAREGARGLIFYDEGRPGCLRPGHRRRAELASTLFQRIRPTAYVLEELVKAADPSQAMQRRFIAYLLRSMCLRDVRVVEEVLPRIREQVATCVQQSDSISELTVWRTFYLKLNLVEEGERSTEAALALEPVTSQDLNIMLSLYRECGREHGAVPVFQNWIRNQNEWGGAGPAYLRLVEKYGTEFDIEIAIRDTAAWLDGHPDDNYVRTAYLGLVERRGTADQTESVLNETATWLAAHPDDTAVRTAYLGLVERRGTADQTESVLNETATWLAAHPDDTAVRTAYLGLVERRGTADQTESVLNETATWLAAHPDATDVCTRFISYLISSERIDDARALAEKVISIHSANSNLVTHYLRLMQDQLNEAETREFYELIFTLFPRDIVIRHSWACWLAAVNSRGAAEAAFKTLMAEHPKFYQPKYSYGRMLLDEERYDEAAAQFRQVLKIHRGHAMAHDGLAMSLLGMARRAEELADDSESAGLFDTVEREFKIAIHWARVALARQAMFFTHLGWFYVGRKRWIDALDAFNQAAEEEPEYFENYWGKGRTLVGLERWRDAAHALNAALEKAPDPFGPPASDDISRLLQRCESELTSDRRENRPDAV